MASIEATVDQKSVDLAPVDPNVIIPKHVQDAARAAEAYYQKEPTAEETAAAEAEAARVAAEAEAARVAADGQHQQQSDPSLPQPSKDDLNSDQWAGRYNSMKGRWESSQRQLGSMQQQLIEAGDEIGRLNTLISRAGVSSTPAGQQAQLGQDHNKLITAEDRETYGDELLDTVSRAAREAIGPELAALRGENESLKKRVITDDQRVLRDALGRAVPNWVAVQRSPEFNSWLRLPNVYTGQVRGNMMRAAYDAADAPKVIALFQDFVKEVQATGGQLPTSARQEQQPAPRTPAMDLAELAAPGKARPAGGDTQTPADKPIYTRADISKFYADSRKGYYAGRQVEYDRIQNDLNAAQREGRIRG